jgi:hypothetical protein
MEDVIVDALGPEAKLALIIPPAIALANAFEFMSASISRERDCPASLGLA